MNKQTLWDILVDSNTYRSFHSRGPSRIIEFVEIFKSNIPFLDSWKVPDFELFLDKDEEKKPLSDFMSGFEVGPAISYKAKENLLNIIEKDVEFLPLKTEVGPYFALHVRLLNCLDKEHSIVRLAKDGSIIGVDRYAINWQVLKNVNIFRINEISLSRLFVSDVFKKTYEENGLEGLIFYPVHLAE